MDRIIEVKVFGNHLSKDSKFAGTRGEGNATKLRITFDVGWDGFAKRVVFWDACGENSVKVLLTNDTLEDVNNLRVHIVPIPQEAMLRAGMMTFCVYGYKGEVKQVSVTGKLEVQDTPEIRCAVNPTPDELEQMQSQLEAIADGISAAINAKNAIQNMSVSSETLSTGEESFVNKEKVGDVVNLHFGLPAGAKGDTGSSGVYVGEEEPSDPSVNVWIKTNEKEDEGFIPLMTSIKTFGAVGDGETDDTEALRAAARSGEAVYFPQGTYLLYGQIDMTESINWVGEGVKSVIKLMPADQTSPAVDDKGNTYYNCYMIHHENGVNRSISLQGLVLDANKSGYKNDVLQNGSSKADHTACLYLHNPSLVYLNNVKITGGLSYGCYIHGSDSTDVSISNCRFTENGYDGTGDGLFIKNVGTDARVSNCKLNSNGNNGLNLNGNNGAIVSNIVCHNNYNGVLLENSDQNVLTGVMCSSNKRGLALWSSAENNTISGLVTKDNEYGVLFGDCDKTVISGWNSVDNYRFCVDYYNLSQKDVTGLVLGTSTTENYKYSGETNGMFKVNFIGG